MASGAARDVRDAGKLASGVPEPASGDLLGAPTKRPTQSVVSWVYRSARRYARMHDTRRITPMATTASGSMRDLDLITLCRGIVAVKANALELLDDANILRANGKLARSYATAYMACEEVGKISILIGAATQIIIGRPVDWKITAKRFRSHNSKASQFMGLANAIPILEAAVSEGQKSVSMYEVLFKSFVGVTVGPMLFETRNASLYCDFVNGNFKRPSDVITREIVDRMISAAETNIRAATLLACDTAEETAEKLKKHTSAKRHDSMMNSMRKFVDDFYSSLPPKEEAKAMMKEIYDRKAEKK